MTEKLSLVIPCYNEQDNIIPFYELCQTAFDGKIDNYQMIFVNDGSKDNTLSVLKQLYEQHDNVTVVGFSRNFGKEAAILAGLQKAHGKYVTIIDADLQQRPETVLQMVEILDHNDAVDVVAAYQERRNEGIFKYFVKTMFYRLMNFVSEVHLHEDASDFRTFRQEVAETMRSLHEYHRFTKGIFAWIGYNTYYLPYVASERNAGKTNWSFLKLLKYSIEGITAYSVMPLKLPIFLGGVTSVASALYLLIRLICLLGSSVPFFTAGVWLAFLLLLWGMTMLAVGVIGIYLAKVYVQVKKRPSYIIGTVLEKTKND